MNIFNLQLLLIISIYKIVKSEWVFYSENVNDNNNNKRYSEKIYFPGKTNKDEVNLKRSYNALPTSFISEAKSNYIEEEESEEQQPSASSHRKKTFSLTSIRDKTTTTRKPFGFNSNTINDYNYSFFTKRNKNETQTSSEESDKRSKKPSFKKISNQTNIRIPPPSLMANTSDKTSLRVCELKYAEYIQRIFPLEADTASDANDAEFHGRILAAPGEYPHMSALGIRSNNGKMDYKCGGSLISENFVITAAHCTNFTGLQPTKVRIGDLNLMIEESYLEPQIRNIKNVFVHPDYKTSSYYHDIALLELDEEVELTEFVRPIRLWTQETLPFSMAYAMGYGATDFARERTNRLTNLNMTIVPNDDCNREMPKLLQTERGILSSQICARDYAQNRDTCQGDSGGPLQLNIKGRRSQNRLHYQLIGITSYGLYCRSGYPSIFTRVCYYLDWIERIVWKDYFA